MRRSRPQKASSRSGEVAEFTRPEGLLRFAAAVGRGGVKTPPYNAKGRYRQGGGPGMPGPYRLLFPGNRSIQRNAVP